MGFKTRPSPDIHAINIRTNEGMVLTGVGRTYMGRHNGSERKALVSGVLGSAATGLVTSFVERLDDVKLFAANWLDFYECGQPVVQSVWRTEQGSLLTPDLKANGGQLYGKALRNCLESGKPPFRPRPIIDRYFLAAITDSEIDTIQAHAFDYAQVASECGLALPEDDSYELHVQLNGGYSLILLDLSMAGGPRKNLLQQNLDSTKYVGHHLRFIRNALPGRQ